MYLMLMELVQMEDQPPGTSFIHLDLCSMISTYLL